MDLSLIYRVYINEVLIPITPGDINAANDNHNEKIILANGKPFTLAKLDGAKKFDFSFDVPVNTYPFAFNDELKSVDFYIDMFEKIKEDRKAVPFTVIRSRGLPSTCIDVLLEDYSYTESADNANDFTFKVSFVVDCPQNNQELDMQVEHHLITAGAARGWVDSADKRELSDAAKQAAEEQEKQAQKEEKLAQKEADAQARKDGGS